MKKQRTKKKKHAKKQDDGKENRVKSKENKVVE